MCRLARLVETTEGVTKAEQLFVVSNIYISEQGIHTTSARPTLIQISNQKLDWKWQSVLLFEWQQRVSLPTL